MLKIECLSKQYKGSGVKAVDNISFDLKEGEIFGFVGANGAGKTTTIKMVAGILPFQEGRITINGFDLKRNAIDAKKQMGYVPDNHSVYDKLTGKEFINFMADIYGISKEERKERAEKFIRIFSLKEAIDKPIKSYSHGMKQKISIIGALIHNPKLWILDEPLTGLDPSSAAELKEYMREHASQGNTVFFSSHILEVVEKVCDRVAIINNGSIIAIGTMDELRKNNLDLEEYFLKLTGKNSDINLEGGSVL